MRAQEKVGFHKKYHGGNRNFSKTALHTRSLVCVWIPAETSHDLGASRSGLGPLLVLATGSARCLAARCPSSGRRLLVSRRSERLAGRGGRKPQQTRHGAWRSHGSPARKGALRHAPLARRGAAPQCPAHCGAYCRSPTIPSHCPNSSTCSHSPSPLMCPLPHPTSPLLFHHPPPHSHSHSTLLRPLPRPHSTVPLPPDLSASAPSIKVSPYSPVYSPISSAPTSTTTVTVSTFRLSEVLLRFPYLSTTPHLFRPMLPPESVTSIRVNLNSRTTHRTLRPHLLNHAHHPKHQTPRS